LHLAAISLQALEKENEMKKTTQAIGAQQATQPAAQSAAPRSGGSSDAGGALAGSPRMTAQRKQLSSAFGPAAQLAAPKKKPLQSKAAPQPAQLAEIKKKPGQK
jgi:hypothetical protein